MDRSALDRALRGAVVAFYEDGNEELEMSESARDEELDAFKRDLRDLVDAYGGKRADQFVVFRFARVLRRSSMAQIRNRIEWTLGYRVFEALHRAFSDVVPFVGILGPGADVPEASRMRSDRIDPPRFEGAIVRASALPWIARRAEKIKPAKTTFGQKSSVEHWALRRLRDPELAGAVNRYTIEGRPKLENRASFVAHLRNVRARIDLQPLEADVVADPEAYALLAPHALTVDVEGVVSDEGAPAALAAALAPYVCAHVNPNARVKETESALAEAGIFVFGVYVKRDLSQTRIAFVASSAAPSAQDRELAREHAIRCAREGSLAYLVDVGPAAAAPPAQGLEYRVSRSLHRKASKINANVDVKALYAASGSVARSARPIVIDLRGAYEGVAGVSIQGRPPPPPPQPPAAQAQAPAQAPAPAQRGQRRALEEEEEGAPGAASGAGAGLRVGGGSDRDEDERMDDREGSRANKERRTASAR